MKTNQMIEKILDVVLVSACTVTLILSVSMVQRINGLKTNVQVLEEQVRIASVKNVELKNEAVNRIVEIVETKVVDTYDEAYEEKVHAIADVVMAESGNQSFRGKYLVACTIINRAENQNVSVYQVMYEDNQYAEPYEFKEGLSEWQSGQETLMYEECILAVRQAFCSTENVYYFCNPETSTDSGLNWIRNNAEYYCTEGDHEFYSEVLR